jgi:hypothetical protein
MDYKEQVHVQGIILVHGMVEDRLDDRENTVFLRTDFVVRP